MNSEQAKTQLLGLKAELEARLSRTHKHLYDKDEPVSPKFSEQIKERENDQLVFTLDQEGQHELRQINHALLRIEAGQYFKCSACGTAIGAARLQAIPYTDLCIDCAAQGSS